MIYLYTDLDTMYDTRYNILEDYLGEKLFKSLADIYLKRELDEIPLVPNIVFKELYKNRDISAMRRPRPVMIQEYIIAKSLEHSQTSMLRDGDGLVTILINTHPYLISKKQKEMFKSYFINHLPNRVTVELITYDKIPYRKYDISEYILYDGIELFNEIVKNDNIQYGRFSDALLIVPDNVFIENITKEKDRYLKILEETYKPFINLEFCSVSFFSYTHPS